MHRANFDDDMVYAVDNSFYLVWTVGTIVKVHVGMSFINYVDSFNIFINDEEKAISKEEA